MWTYIGTIADDNFNVKVDTGTEAIQVYLRSAHGGCGANGAIGYSGLCKETGINDAALLLASVGPDFRVIQERFGDRTYHEILKSKEPYLISILHESESPTTSFDVAWTPPAGEQLSAVATQSLRKFTGPYQTEMTEHLFHIPFRIRRRVEREVFGWAQTYKINEGSMKDFEDVKIVSEFLRDDVIPHVKSEALEKISVVGGTLEMQDVVIGILRSLPSTKDSLIHYTPGSAIFSLKRTPFSYMTRSDFIKKILTKVDILQLNTPERYHLMGGHTRAVYELLSHRSLRKGRTKIVLCTTPRCVSDYYQESSDLALKVLDATEMGIAYSHDFLCQRKERRIDISDYMPNIQQIEETRMKVHKNRTEKGEKYGIKRTDFPVPNPVKRVSPVGAGDAFGCGLDFDLNSKL